MANTAGDAADQVLGSAFVETVRANPIPAAMIGIGAAWMLFNRRAESRGYRYSRRDSGYPYDTPRGYDYGTYDSGGDRAYGGTYGAVGTRGTADNAASNDEAGSMTSRAKEYASDVTARAQEFSGDLRDTARRTSRRAQVRFNDVLRNNPLALGAAAVLVGAVVGMTVPATETENQLMGEARDSVVDRARGLAKEAANRVGEAADNAQNVVSRAAGQVKDVASRAADTPRSGSTRTTLPNE